MRKNESMDDCRNHMCTETVSTGSTDCQGSKTKMISSRLRNVTYSSLNSFREAS